MRIERVERLHIGCGKSPIPGWVNVDQFPLPGVDRVLDVGEGLPFRDVSLLYAEHFLEHLSLQEGLAFLRGCRRVLAGDGVLRLSTPNLDWVMKTHYRLGSWGADEEALEDCLKMNRAFHGWGHQFLYNRQTLSVALRAAGFEKITFHRYGESDRAELAGLERHETCEDEPDLPHVIIAQAAGVSLEAGNPEPFQIYHRDLTLR
ncbi:MAG: class I SAM-dependent methyltransferase [Thermoanaerobaculia bacterium]